ncbi:response regulator [Saccharibacillus qingshengii]|uniref:response regulator n=1 Tax=Saccharibacillus qingshengii TaxID=1763540 RepID=UPI0015552C78|nr:response regulator [Saccharibacillus qingshengii]
MRTVFFVDDEPLIARGMSSILDWEKYGLQPCGQAGDGVQALERLGDTGADLVITDIMMPRMNGLELIAELKKHHPNMRFIVLSGYEEFEYVKVGIRLGIENYILKPINIEELQATVRRIGEVWEREEASRVRQEEDRRVLRSNVLVRWTQGEIGREELLQRAVLLEIPTDCGEYRVDVIRVLVGEGGAESAAGDAVERQAERGAGRAGLPAAGDAAERQAEGEAGRGGMPAAGDAAEQWAEGGAGRAGMPAAGDAAEQWAEGEAGRGGMPADSAAVRPSCLAEICEALLAAAEPGAAAICFADADDDIVCIRCRSAAGTPRQASSGAALPEDDPVAEAARELGRRVGAAVWLAGGGSSPDMAGVHASFAEAQAQLRRLLPAGERQLWISGPDTAPEPQGSSLSWEERLLGGAAEAAEWLPRREPVNTAVRLMLESVRTDGAAEPAEPDYGGLYAPLQRIRTLEELRRHVRLFLRGDSAAGAGQAAAGPAHSAHVAFLLEQIRDHYAEELSLKTLSQRLDLHPNYLGQLFQQETGGNFSDVLNRRRIDRATALLLHTNRRTAEIGAEVGYTDNSYFYRQFKKYTGLSPTELRSAYGGDG